MTLERLNVATQLSKKIECIKKQLDDLEYIENSGNSVQLAVKDGRKTYDCYVTVPVGFFTQLVVSEVKTDLLRQLTDAEEEFRKL